jgi:HlyD family secretion protein
MSRMWVLIIGLVVVGSAAGGGFYLHERRVRAEAFQLPDDVYLATAEVGDIVQSVQSPGQISSNLDVAIKCQASGKVIELPFDISAQVKQGDVLMKLDPTDENIVLEQTQATLAEANSRLIEAKQAEQQAELDLATAKEKAQADLQSAQIQCTNMQRKADRQRNLFDQKLTSQEDYETAESDAAQSEDALQAAKIAQEQIKSQEVALETKNEDINLAAAEYQLDKIAVDQANQQVGYCTVTAPRDGVIADIPTTIGVGTVIASALSNVSGGTTVMTLSDLSHIFVLATVDESDIGGVLVGQKVIVTADAYPGKSFDGVVNRISPQGVTSSNVVTFEVKIEVTSANKSLLKPQMTANAQIIEDTRQNVLMVPMLAVVHQHQKMYVSVQKADNTSVDEDVVTGINDGDNIEIVSGLKEGDQILVYKNEAENKWTSQGQPQSRPLRMPPTGGGGRR